MDKQQIINERVTPENTVNEYKVKKLYLYYNKTYNYVFTKVLNEHVYKNSSVYQLLYSHKTMC